MARPSTEQDKELLSKAAWSPPGLRATEDWAPGPKRWGRNIMAFSRPTSDLPQLPASLTQPHSERLRMTCRGWARPDPAADGRSLARGAAHTSLGSDSLLISVKLCHVSTPTGTPCQTYVVQTMNFIHTQYVRGKNFLGKRPSPATVKKGKCKARKAGGLCIPEHGVQGRGQRGGHPGRHGMKERSHLPLWLGGHHSVRGLVR